MRRDEEEVLQLRRLERASVVEASTLLVLVGVAVPLKYMFGVPQVTKVMGPVHGIAFLFYCWTVVQTVAGGGWRAGEIVRLLLVAFVPVAGFLNVGWIRRRARAGLELRS